VISICQAAEVLSLLSDIRTIVSGITIVGQSFATFEERVLDNLPGVIAEEIVDQAEQRHVTGS
jgi:hypothetical protein